MKHIPRASVASFDFKGLSIADFGPGPGSSASVALITVLPGVKHPEARSRKSDKYYYCLEGPVAFQVESQKIDLATSDMLVINAGEWFSYANTGIREGKLLLIHVPPFDLGAEEFRKD